MMKNSKKGFNLIEIAIVLAVVGLVIGGIYVAASSVTDNQRKQKAQTQLLQIVQNLRTLYSSQTVTAAVVTADTMINSRVTPADMTKVDNNNVAGAYGNVAVETIANGFKITLYKVGRGACIDILSKNFGSQSSATQIGLLGATGATALANASAIDGITVTEATGSCTAETNDMTFYFSSNV